MVILVCGGRDYTDSQAIARVLNAVHRKRTITRLIIGDCRGADRCAAAWAVIHDIPVSPFGPNWKRYGKAAGPIRNGRMLKEGKPDAVIAFPGGKGTADMVHQAECAGVPIWQPYG